MLVDLDYFFAQCEEIRNPSLKGKPVVVCVYSGRTEDSGAVSTANYEARKYGVKSGIPIALAKKRLKEAEAVFLPVDKEFYKEISDNIMEILRNYADHFEQISIDEAYLDVTQKTRVNYQEAKEMATAIKYQILNRQHLTCSVGIGPNKLVAKIAADVKRPDGLTIVRLEHVRSFLALLPVRSLVGVGKKTEQKLETFGVKTIGHLARFDVQKLVETFGKTLGVYFHNASLGKDDEPVEERGEPESISRISTLKEDTRNLDIILAKGYKLCADVHAKLLSLGLIYRSVGIQVVGSNLTVYSRSKTFDTPSNNLEQFKMTTQELFEKFLEESDVNARRVGVRLSNLMKREKEQKQITSFFGISK